MTMQTYSYGCTPEDVIKKAVMEQCPNGYPMTIRSQLEWGIIAEAWNQGIDSHLEAITNRSKADSKTGEVLIHPEELHILLRRLAEIGESESFSWEDAMSLRIDILSTLEIEEI